MCVHCRYCIGRFCSRCRGDTKRGESNFGGNAFSPQFEPLQFSAIAVSPARPALARSSGHLAIALEAAEEFLGDCLEILTTDSCTPPMVTFFRNSSKRAQIRACNYQACVVYYTHASNGGFRRRNLLFDNLIT